jgi:hypothetical protein
MSAKFEMILANCLGIDVWQELVDNRVSRHQARSHADIVWMYINSKTSVEVLQQGPQRVDR